MKLEFLKDPKVSEEKPRHGVEALTGLVLERWEAGG